MRNGLVFPDNCRAIIDVTKAPYYVDNTGKTDCTKQIIKILDDIIATDLDAFRKTVSKLKSNPNPDARINFEVLKIKGRMNVIFAEDLPESRIIYFPDGTYLVSDTISYSYEDMCNILRGVRKFELNRLIHFKGQNKDKVIIKLMDGCKGFEYGSQRPVISFMRGEHSNVAMTNSFENITIDIGCNNPGAVGLVFFGNNTGTVRNVTIKSSDNELRGNTGLAVIHEIVSGCYVKNVEIIGFDYGIKVTPARNFTVFEHISLLNQRKSGFYIYNTITSIHNLYSKNSVPGLRIAGPTAHVVLINGKFEGGGINYPAIEYEMGTLFVRNISSTGYNTPISYCTRQLFKSNYIDEYCSHDVYTLFEKQTKRSLNLVIDETPDIQYENNMSEWTCVNDFGAKGNGITDDTASIQKAMDSGAGIIYFQPGKYLINSTVKIPGTVNRVNFMYCNLVAGNDLKGMSKSGAFAVTGESERPLIMEDLLAWQEFHGYMRLIDHASARTLIMSDLHTQAGAMYFNSVTGGRVYIENVACTVGGVPYKGVPCFHFKNQTVWARHLNPERSLKQVINDGSVLWVLGFKTEGEGTAYETINGGCTEILGGVVSLGHNKEYPAIVNDNSNVTAIFSTNGYSEQHLFPIAVREIRGDLSCSLEHTRFPVRFVKQYVVPMYAGCSQKLVSINEDK